jgi:4'-phosphopantetheinyl transferase EntD
LKSTYEFVCMKIDSTCGANRLEAYLHPNELEKIKKAVNKRKLEFFYGRLCAKLAYARLCGTDVFDKRLCVYEDYCGTPYFKDGSCRVSITHDDGLAAAIVTKRDVLRAGLDVQKITPKNTDVIYKFLLEDEKELVDRYAGEYGKDFLTTAFWVAKESMSKLLEYGFSIYDVLKIKSIEGGANLQVKFNEFNSFSVLIRRYDDYLFGFAAPKKNIDCFNEENLEIKITQI